MDEQNTVRFLPAVANDGCSHTRCDAQHKNKTKTEYPRSRLREAHKKRAHHYMTIDKAAE